MTRADHQYNDLEYSLHGSCKAVALTCNLTFMGMASYFCCGHADIISTAIYNNAVICCIVTLPLSEGGTEQQATNSQIRDQPSVRSKMSKFYSELV